MALKMSGVVSILSLIYLCLAIRSTQSYGGEFYDGKPSGYDDPPPCEDLGIGRFCIANCSLPGIYVCPRRHYFIPDKPPILSACPSGLLCQQRGGGRVKCAYGWDCHPVTDDPNVTISTGPSTTPGPSVVTNVIPGNLSRDEIPQFVYFSFDDAVNRMNYNLYSNLFAGRFVNPNGCPTTVSFNLCNESTNYELVRRLHRQGHEIASHSILHTNPKFWDGEMWEYEIQGMRELISDKIGIKEDEIVGMRSPFLVLGGNKQFSLLERFNYTYDASMVPAFSSNQEEPLWPFKLTGKPPRRYFFEPGTPTEAYPSVWEVPMNPYFYCPHAPDGAVSMLDGCHPGSYNATYLYLKYNFLRHYNSPSKAPFGINMHAAWFHPAWPYHFQAMEDFIGEICRLRNVYIVSVSRILKWMEDPVPLSRMSESEAVKCD